MPGQSLTSVLAGTTSSPLTRHIEPVPLTRNFLRHSCRTASMERCSALQQGTMAWRPDIMDIFKIW
eukprot:5221061-Amphidinium_carterae.1